MQVFMPFTTLHESVRCLDPKRLGNQIYREGKTLITGGWPHHPASKIWIGHKHALAKYCLHGLNELADRPPEQRGKVYPKWYDFYLEILANEPDTGLPEIIGYERFHSGHRAALLAKDPDWYSQFGWTETPEPDTKRAYVWTLN